MLRLMIYSRCSEDPDLSSYLEYSLLVSPFIGFFAGALLVVLTTRIFPRVSLKGENIFVLVAFALLLLAIKTQLTK